MIKEFLYHHLELDTWNSRRQFGLFKSSWRKNETLTASSPVARDHWGIFELIIMESGDEGSMGKPVEEAETLINVFVFARVKIHSGFLFFPLLIKIMGNFLPDQNVYTES